MKNLLFLLLLMVPMSLPAQNENTSQDTIFYAKGRKIVIKEQGNKIKVKLYEKSSNGDSLVSNTQIFEGVYLNGRSTENRTILDALPFSNKRKKGIRSLRIFVVFISVI